MRKVIGITIRVIGLALLLVIEDSLLWVAPKLSDEALRPWRAATFEANCREIRVGTSMDDAIRTMSQGRPVRYEIYGREHGKDGTGTLVFWIDEGRPTTGDCVISLDPNNGTVTEVRSAAPQSQSPERLK